MPPADRIPHGCLAAFMPPADRIPHGCLAAFVPPATRIPHGCLGGMKCRPYDPAALPPHPAPDGRARR